MTHSITKSTKNQLRYFPTFTVIPKRQNMSSKTRPDYPLPYLKLVKSGIPGFGIRIQLKESGILQSGYRFSDRNGAKTPPFGTAHTYVADLREYPPGFRLHLMSNTRYLILAVQPNLPYPNSPKIKRVT